jgi:hypothetical protein
VPAEGCGITTIISRMRKCALRSGRDFYGEAVVSFCRERGIEIMDDMALLQRLKTSEPTTFPPR